MQLSIFWISRQRPLAAWAVNWIVISDFEQRSEIVLKFSKLSLLMALVVKFVNNSAWTLAINNENEFFAYGDLVYLVKLK